MLELLFELAKNQRAHVIVNPFERHATAAAPGIHTVTEFQKLLTQMFDLKVPPGICELFIYYTGHGVSGSGNIILQGLSEDEEMSASDILTLFTDAKVQLPVTINPDSCSSGSMTINLDLSQFSSYPLRIITATAHEQTALVGNLIGFLTHGTLMFSDNEDEDLQSPSMVLTDSFSESDSILQFPALPSYAVNETDVAVKGKARHFRKREVRNHELKELRRNLVCNLKRSYFPQQFNNNEGYLPAKLDKHQMYYEAEHPTHPKSGRSMTAMGVAVCYDKASNKLGHTYYTATHWGTQRLKGVPDPKDPKDQGKNRRNVFERLAFVQAPKSATSTTM